MKGIKRLSPGLNPIAPVMHKLYFEAACKQGAVMSRNELPGNQTHFTTPAASEPFYLQWIDDRFAGKRVSNGCPNA